VEAGPMPRFETDATKSRHTTRRQVLEASAGAGLLGLSALGATTSAAEQESTQPTPRKGRIRQSIVFWCFEKYWDMPQLLAVAKQLGCASVELSAPKYYPLIKKSGLDCAIGSIDMGPDPPFVRGFNHTENHDEVIKATKDAIDACAAHGIKKVIAFTGMRKGLPDDVGAANCVEGFKKVVGYAEKNDVTICLEMLNSRVSDHPMKGHPDYQGDRTDYCVEIIKRVGSPSLKLLFDIYHVQIMDGDIIRRIREHKDYIAHVHTAGNPGRGELDDKQEIAYRPIMEALVEIGYEGFVGQEFIPTRDPLEGLRQAVALCDV
jgi:hydroxypyruvate isomerase